MILIVAIMRWVKGDVTPLVIDSITSSGCRVGISWMVTRTRKSSDVTRAGSLQKYGCYPAVVSYSTGQVEFSKTTT